jgi:hypothetical protein
MDGLIHPGHRFDLLRLVVGGAASNLIPRCPCTEGVSSGQLRRAAARLAVIKSA